MDKKKNFDLFALISSVSGIVTIVDFVIRSFDNHAITFSWISIVGVFVSLLFVSVFIVRRNPSIGYGIKKHFIFWFLHFSEPLEVESKESTYIFIDRTHMEHNKKHHIKSNVAQLSEFSDKFKWSKPQSMDEVNELLSNVVSDNPDDTVTATRYENWIKYSVGFSGIGKGATKDISVSIKNLEDSNMESLLFLSGGVVFKTHKLKMKVVFNDVNLTPKCIEYKIYSNYASSYPLIKKELKLEHDDENNIKYIEYIESKPIPGYRYVIEWKF